MKSALVRIFVAAFLLWSPCVIQAQKTEQLAVKFSPSVLVPSVLDRSVFERRDLIYGSEIGAWDQDGGTAVNSPTARRNIIAAKIRVIRWGNWAKFDDMNQGGSAPKQTLAQFNNAVDGIRTLGAVAMIKLPPIWDKQCEGAIDYWNLEWLKEIIKNAGSRVQLYEFGNEPDHYCNMTGTTYGQKWNETVPALKKYARSLGFEIFVGGPAMANNYVHSLEVVNDFLKTVKSAYVVDHDRDFIPDFVSSHTYPNTTENVTLTDFLNRIDYWGKVYDTMRQNIDEIWQGESDGNGQSLGPQIKLADSEWNMVTGNDPRAMDPRWTKPYVAKMFRMFREHHIWLANLFTISSHKGAALDMLKADGTPKPLYESFAAVSTTDPLNKDENR